MDKLKYFIGGPLKKFFRGLPERKRQKIVAQAIAGVFLVAAAIVGMGTFHHQAVGQLEKYQEIADICIRPGIILEGKKEETRKKTEEEKEEFILDVDVERYKQEGGTERSNDSIGVYDWDELCNINKDIKGWLCIPGSLINFPVTETDDNDFYLSHDFAGNKSSSGCPFMDKDTQDWDFNRVIYGHNMGDGSDAMFSTLLYYEEEEYFKENQTFYYTEAYGSTTAYQVMAVVKYNIEDLEEWDFRTRNHPNMDSYDTWMEQLQGRALYYAEPGHTPDSIIILSTCDRREHGKNGRFLVVGAEVYTEGDGKNEN